MIILIVWAERFRLQNNEVKERVDNWYGDIISFINNLKKKNIKILDYGSGPGHLLNFINKVSINIVLN